MILVRNKNMAAGKLMIFGHLLFRPIFLAGVFVSICGSCEDLGRFMLSPDLHWLSCFLGGCLMVWALGDGRGWASVAGAVFWPSVLGVEDLAVI